MRFMHQKASALKGMLRLSKEQIKKTNLCSLDGNILGENILSNLLRWSHFRKAFPLHTRGS